MMIKEAKIMEEDWDYLIILDTCRYDYFEGIVYEFFVGKLEKRVSLGKETPQWQAIESRSALTIDVEYTGRIALASSLWRNI